MEAKELENFHEEISCRFYRMKGLAEHEKELFQSNTTLSLGNDNEDIVSKELDIV